MERKSIIPGRTYAYDCLLDATITGFDRVQKMSDCEVIDHLEYPSDKERFLKNKYPNRELQVVDAVKVF